MATWLICHDNAIISPGATVLQVKGGAAWSALADIKAVHVSVAANSKAIPYSSLRKDAIAHREVSTVLGRHQGPGSSTFCFLQTAIWLSYELLVSFVLDGVYFQEICEPQISNFPVGVSMFTAW